MFDWKKHIKGLDSLRGIAALIVVFNHFCLAGFSDFYQSFWYKWTPLHWVFDGRLPVILFFVLSGFVLSRKYVINEDPPIKSFILSRLARIYLPFLFAMLVAAVLYWGVTTAYPDRAFEWNEWKYDISLTSFMSHIFATGLVGSNHLNPPVWTLVQELRVAIIFPILIWFVRKGSFAMVISSIVLGYLGVKLFKQIEPAENLYFAETFIGSLLLTLYYIQFFVFGIFIAFKIDWIKSVMSHVPEKIHYLAIIVMFLVPVALFDGQYMIREMWFAAIAMYLVATCVLYPSLEKHLQIAPLQWLGNVSFSLYLIHTPLILALIYILLPHLPIWGILILSFPLILIASHFMYKYIEKPCTGLSKALSKPKSKE